MSSGRKPILFTRILNARLQMATQFTISVACPDSSKAITITAAPYHLQKVAFHSNSCSPSFKEIELTIHFPYEFFSPSSIILKFEESITIGT